MAIVSALLTTALHITCTPSRHEWLDARDRDFPDARTLSFSRHSVWKTEHPKYAAVAVAVSILVSFASPPGKSSGDGVKLRVHSPVIDTISGLYLVNVSDNKVNKL